MRYNHNTTIMKLLLLDPYSNHTLESCIFNKSPSENFGKVTLSSSASIDKKQRKITMKRNLFSIILTFQILRFILCIFLLCINLFNYRQKEIVSFLNNDTMNIN